MAFRPARFPDKAAAEVVPVALTITTPPAGETVASVSWLSYPAGLSFGNPAIVGFVITADVSGGAEGTDYAISPVVTFSLGHVFQDPAGVRQRVVAVGFDVNC